MPTRSHHSLICRKQVTKSVQEAGEGKGKGEGGQGGEAIQVPGNNIFLFSVNNFGF